MSLHHCFWLQILFSFALQTLFVTAIVFLLSNRNSYMVQAVVCSLLTGLHPTDLTDLSKSIDQFSVLASLCQKSLFNLVCFWVWGGKATRGKVKYGSEVERGEAMSGLLTGHEVPLKDKWPLKCPWNPLRSPFIWGTISHYLYYKIIMFQIYCCMNNYQNSLTTPSSVEYLDLSHNW